LPQRVSQSRVRLWISFVNLYRKWYNKTDPETSSG